ncbi:MAG: EamA family transporter [Acidobacteriota bacterium]|nr:EamA family transporter [Acidobacteriota bacterium]
MTASPDSITRLSSRSLHQLGVVCGLGAGAWLGTAEAPTKLVTVGFSPFLISLGMVSGVFVARWTLPMLLKGNRYIWLDFREKPHLVVWAILAGMLWAVANTLTVFAIRNVGLSIAFPLWNSNSLVGLFWGWLLFNELRGAGSKQWLKVLGGTVALVAGACLLAYATTHQAAGPTNRSTLGILAAIGAGALWGTMYIPYRKAYISGMNPLSFVTVFTFGELGTTLLLALIFQGGFHKLSVDLLAAQPALFWLFLGGFCWVIGDLFQQYAAKYIGIGRGIPLSNTNQLWGLAWGALVFGELSGLHPAARWMVIAGSLIMILGAASISFAEAPVSEHASWNQAMQRECTRYGLQPDRVSAILQGDDPFSRETSKRNWWELLFAVVALAIFIRLAFRAQRQAIAFNVSWMIILSAATITFLVVCGGLLWKRTRFS